VLPVGLTIKIPLPEVKERKTLKEALGLSNPTARGESPRTLAFLLGTAIDRPINPRVARLPPK
jgi:hypothetical protein